MQHSIYLQQSTTKRNTKNLQRGALKARFEPQLPLLSPTEQGRKRTCDKAQRSFSGFLPWEPLAHCSCRQIPSLPTPLCSLAAEGSGVIKPHPQGRPEKRDSPLTQHWRREQRLSVGRLITKKKTKKPTPQKQKDPASLHARTIVRQSAGSKD